MQAVLVLLALEVVATQQHDFAVVPPQKAHHSKRNQVRYGDLCPVRALAPDRQRRNDLDPIPIREGLLVRIVQVDGDEDGDAKDGDAGKDEDAHADEAQKDRGVHADVVDELRLACVP